MLTLMILPAFKGTRLETFKALLTTLFLDGIIAAYQFI
jgi:hypothetical protein